MTDARPMWGPSTRAERTIPLFSWSEIGCGCCCCRTIEERDDFMLRSYGLVMA